MSTKWRSFEMLVPRRFNDGRDVPGERISQAILEIVDHFGAAGHGIQPIVGLWQNGGVLYQDDLARIAVDVTDLPPNREWMKQFKARWKQKLDQLEIWMVSYRIKLE
jgi:hypothetical protein